MHFSIQAQTLFIWAFFSLPIIAACVAIHSSWWAHLGSNQGPTGYEPVALPAELWALSIFI
jgi:hypothetical protein